MELPTDTQFIRLETRQYEIFNRPLGQGISRRKMAVFSVIAVTWSAVIAVIGVNPLSGYGPTVYLFPIAVVSWKATAADESGRMSVLVWYDWLLARVPHRRRLITNPVMGIPDRARAPFAVTITTELHPCPAGGVGLVRLVGWRSRAARVARERGRGMR